MPDWTSVTAPHVYCLARTIDAAQVAGATYRELDHWVRRGWLPGANPGSGRWRAWTPAQIAAAVAMTRLVRAGLTPAAAARVVGGEAELAPGVRVEVAANA